MELFSSRQGILFLLLLLCFQSAPTSADTFPGDAAALRQFAAAVDPSSIPPGSCLSSWDFSSDPCDSLFSATRFTCGFRCDTRDAAGFSRVTDVALDAAGYSAPLSPSVWSLPFLQTLDLPDNRFSGPIPPPPLPSSAVLRRLTLSRNAFSGDLPPDLLLHFPSLEELYLDNNLLTGRIPISATSAALKRLEIQANNFSGELPDFHHMTNLAYLDASDNGISGGISGDSLPPSLVEICLRGNGLVGPIPESLPAALPDLEVLDLSRNRMSGHVPAALFAHPVLQQLTLSYNRFTSMGVPAAAGGSGLVAVDLGHNRLSGMLPMGFVAAMPRLTALTLEENLFTGMIPTEYAVRVVAAPVPPLLGVAAPLERLVLRGNYLYGPIPGPLTWMRESGDAMVSLADNCLFRCPEVFFFCRGGQQKEASVCRQYNPVIP